MLRVLCYSTGYTQTQAAYFIMNHTILFSFIFLVNQPPVFDQSPMFPNELFSVSDNFYNSPTNVIIEDVNQDGFPDAVYQLNDGTQPFLGTVAAAINNGIGGIREMRKLDSNPYWVERIRKDENQWITDQTGQNFVEIVIYPNFVIGYVEVDWNQDGKDDLFLFSKMLSFHNPGFVVVIAKEDGMYETGLVQLEQAPQIPSDRGWGKENFGDINNDGIEDRIIQSRTSLIAGKTDIEIELGTPSGEFVLFDSYPIDPLLVFYTLSYDTIVLHDFNEDGNVDILRIQIEWSQGTMRLGNGDGTFQEEYNLNLGFPAVFQDLGDFNGDGSADILLKQAYTDVSLPDTFFISLSNKDGTFQPFRTFPFLASKPFGNLDWRNPVTVVDYNQDVLDDLWFDNGLESDLRVSGVWVNQYRLVSGVDEYSLYQ